MIEYTKTGLIHWRDPVKVVELETEGSGRTGLYQKIFESIAARSKTIDELAEEFNIPRRKMSIKTAYLKRKNRIELVGDVWKAT